MQLLMQLRATRGSLLEKLRSAVKIKVDRVEYYALVNYCIWKVVQYKTTDARQFATALLSVIESLPLQRSLIFVWKFLLVNGIVF